MDISIFVPCYNEEENILPTLQVIHEAFQQLNLTWEVIVIDDASTDQTVSRCRSFLAKHPTWPIRLEVCAEHKGLAQNFVDGAMLAKGQYYHQVCGDNVVDADLLVKLYRKLGQADLLIPYPNGRPERSWFRLLLSWLYTFLVNLVSGFRLRYYNGLPVYLRTDVVRWHSNYYGFGYQADLIIRLLERGAKYEEIPVLSRDRNSGHSKALTLKNFLSVAHFFFDLALRRFWKSCGAFSNPLGQSLIVAVILFTLVRSQLAVTLGQDAGIQMQAAYRLQAGLGVTSYLESVPSLDLAQPLRPTVVNHWPPGYSLLLAALFQLGLSPEAAIKLVCGVCTLAGWWGWATVLHYLLGERIKNKDRSLDLWSILLFFLPLIDTPSWRGTDIIVWSVLPYTILLFLGKPSLMGVALLGLLVGFCYLFRFAGLFIEASYGLIILSLIRLNNWRVSAGQLAALTVGFLLVLEPTNHLISSAGTSLGPPAEGLSISNLGTRVGMVFGNLAYLTLPILYWLPNHWRAHLIESTGE